MHRLLFYVLSLAVLVCLDTWQGMAIEPALSPKERLKQDTNIQVRGQIEPLLERYCGDSCQIIHMDTVVQEDFAEEDELGFESHDSLVPQHAYKVRGIQVDLQVDSRISSVHRDKLHRLILVRLKNIGALVNLHWTTVELPRLGHNLTSGDHLKEALGVKLEGILLDVIARYCPLECLLSDVSISGSLVSPDEVPSKDPKEIIKDPSGNQFFQIDRIAIYVSMDTKMAEAERIKILNLMKAKTQFLKPVIFTLDAVPFPESYEDKKIKAQAASTDPHGLDKLRQMLILFRDLAGSAQDVSSKDASITTNSKMNSKMNKELGEDQPVELPTMEWGVYVLAGFFVVGLLWVLFMRIGKAQRDTQMMLASGPGAGYGSGYGGGMSVGKDSELHEGGPESRISQTTRSLAHSEVSVSVGVHTLKEQLIQIFMDSPKVAKETFTRLLEEDGIEHTAKYVHIFGKLIVFELLSDPNVSRFLYELSEFYHKSNFQFTAREELDLLKGLKVKVTANEIRILSRRSSDQFEFLLKLDPSQIYSLVSDESAQVQSIVMTQLIPRQRNAVFQLFTGANRLRLMSELCKSDGVPKEFLGNVAQALNKKVMAKPEFDTQNLKSIEIIMDLLERAAFQEQKMLMHTLMQNNPEAARGIKLKLVTLGMLPYLKDGHLLEIILGMERSDLLGFLSGCPEDIRQLLWSKAPRELAESWAEELEHIQGIDESRYRMAEMMILSRIRNLAAQGVVHILDINDLLFGGVVPTPPGGKGKPMAHQSIVT